MTGINWKGNSKIPEFWPPEIQIMAKDIFRVHTTIWPALLLALNLPLPRKLYIHGYFTISGQKMSKSLGNVINPIEIAEKYSPDVLKYYLLREIPFGQDGDISMKRLKERYNSDLANDLGNLVQRTAVMIEKFLDGKIPTLNIDLKPVKNIKKEIQVSTSELGKIDELMENLRFNEVLEEIWDWIARANKYIDYQKPWKLAQKDFLKLNKVLSSLVGTILDVAFYLQPFMPDTALKINEIFKGSEIGKFEVLFPKLTNNK